MLYHKQLALKRLNLWEVSLKTSSLRLSTKHSLTIPSSAALRLNDEISIQFNVQLILRGLSLKSSKGRIIRLARVTEVGHSTSFWSPVESWKWDKVITASKNADGGGHHNFPTAELMERALSKVKCVLEIKSIRKAFRVKPLTRARLKGSKKEKSEKLPRSKTRQSIWTFQIHLLL